jgi:hypothetical protein
MKGLWADLTTLAAAASTDSATKDTVSPHGGGAESPAH